jgi:hypothetical protein
LYEQQPTTWPLLSQMYPLLLFSILKVFVTHNPITRSTCIALQVLLYFITRIIFDNKYVYKSLKTPQFSYFSRHKLLLLSYFQMLPSTIFRTTSTLYFPSCNGHPYKSKCKTTLFYVQFPKLRYE